MKLFAILGLVALAVAEPTVYFQERFNSGDLSQWVNSEHKDDLGKFEVSAGKFYGDAEKDKGAQTSQDAKFYAMSAKFDKFSNKDKKTVIQFTVKHEQNIDCGGGYVKVFPSDLDQKDMHGESPYNIMFGPDICGPGTKKVHVIFNYKGKNLLTKKDIRCKDDQMTHLYTLIVNSDNSYEVRIDNKKAESGTLEADWDFLAPKKIKDPEAKKPEDWDDKEDWDDEMDGEWEPPMIDNPDFKGEWKPKQIPNPNYKGPWIHPEIDNPEYVADDKLYLYKDIGAIGFDLWQVKSGTIFDNVHISDNIKEAEEAAKLWEATKDAEKKMKDSQDEEERKKREEEDAKRKEEGGDDEEEEDEDDEEGDIDEPPMDEDDEEEDAEHD